MHIRPLLLVSALAAAGCATTGSLPAAPPETVELRFDLQPGSAHVETTEVRTMRFGPNEQVRRTTGRSTTRVIAVDEGFALVDEDVRFETDPPNPVVQDLAAKMVGQVHLIVGPDGEIVAMAGLEDLQATVLGWFDQIDHGPMPPHVVRELRATMEQATDPEILANREASNWHMRVGFWRGRHLEIGRRYELPEEHVAYGAIERLPCVDGEKELRCVRLELVYTTPQEALQPALEMMGRHLAADGAGQAIGMTNEDRIELVVRPETLQPYGSVKRRLSVTTVQQPNGERYTIERDEVDTTSWRYE